MKKILIISFFAILFFPEIVLASDKDPKILAEQKTRKILEACQPIPNEQLPNMPTSEMRQSMAASTKCMEDQIIKLVEQRLYPKSEGLIEEAKKELKEMHSAYSSFYWKLYNKRDICSPACGTINQVRADAAYAQLLEKMLYNIYFQLYLDDISAE